MEVADAEVGAVGTVKAGGERCGHVLAVEDFKNQLDVVRIQEELREVLKLEYVYGG